MKASAAALVATAVLQPVAAWYQKPELYELDFSGVGVPEGAEQHQVIGSKAASLRSRAYQTDWHTISRTGEEYPYIAKGGDGSKLYDKSDVKSWPYGLVVDIDGNPLSKPTDGGRKSNDLDVSNEPDFVSYLQPGGTNTIYSFTHFESPRPGTLYLSALAQDTDTCELKIASTGPIDWSSWQGLWIPCAGFLTSWGTHLAGEEYEPDARALSEATAVDDLNEDIVGFMRYFDTYPADITDVSVITSQFNPYKYGYMFEAAVDAEGTVSTYKHMSMGRFSHELGIVMPDERTVYMTDDGDNVGFFAFVADTPGGLADGTLYAAKMTQLSADAGGTFMVQWINLGHATQAEIEAAADTMTFDSLFDTEAPAADMTCPTPGFKGVVAGAYGGVECLRLKPGMEKFASRFETRRYAATLGATTEFSKWEGITLDPSNMKIRTSITSVRNGMEDFAAEGEASKDYDIASANNVRLPYNPCGCVYELQLVACDGWWQAQTLKATLCGTPSTDAEDPNSCLVDGLSSPDNTISAEDRLIVAEDTKSHVNNMLWAASLSTGAGPLTRVLTAVVGAEITGVYWHGDINGCAYLTASIQHPYEDLPMLLAAPESTGEAGWVGYVGPLKLKDQDDAKRVLSSGVGRYLRRRKLLRSS